MMRWWASWALAAALCCGPATAEQLVVGFDQSEIDITVTFDGSDIFVVGAISRDAPQQPSSPGVIVAVSGPLQPVTVRQQERIMGIWVNAESAEIDLAPSFYALATTEPLRDILTYTDDFAHQISLPNRIRAVGTEVADQNAYVDALIRIRTEDGLYQMLEGGIELREDTLFYGRMSLPANLTEGEYEARIFLTRDGEVIDTYTRALPVNRVGLERWLYAMAHNNPMVYGLLSLAIAIFAGWSASAAFTLFRR